MTTYQPPKEDSHSDELFTEGISPKLIWPALILISIGVIAVIIGLVIDESVLTYIGIGLLGAAGIQIPTAFAAPPGTVLDSRPPDKVHLP